MSEITTYTTDKGDLKLTTQIVKKYLVNGNGNATEQEIMMFIALCKFQNLNPFLKEAYLIKFGNNPATMVVGKDVFTKRASQIKTCAGWNAGITVQKRNGEIERRNGTLILQDELLVGGWCKVYRHDWQTPLEHEVSMTEYDKKQSSWKTMPATMIRKVAIVAALRDSFPSDFQGMYDAAEMPIDFTKIEDNKIEDDFLGTIQENKIENIKKE
jgi:phage recombination protein Bet